MPLTTIRVYSRAGHAEFGETALAAHGIHALLLDNNATRTISSDAVSVALQVADEDVERALAILKDSQPELFGSEQVVAGLQTNLKRDLARYAGYVFLAGAVCFFVVARRGELWGRCGAALLLGMLCGIPLTILHVKLTSRTANHFPQPPPGAAD
jgi:hypothetical protein